MGPDPVIAPAAGHPPGALVVPPMAGLIGQLVGAIVGGVAWTVSLAAKFILDTVGALVSLLIPRSWIHAGMSIMHWLVAVPDYTGRITTPSGAHVYGFAGINDLRELFLWVAIATLPLTLIYASSRAALGSGDHVAMPVIRTLTIAAGLVFYEYAWQQLGAFCNQLTNFILGVPAVTVGIQKLFTFIVSGSLLAGWPLIGEILMAAAAGALLGFIFLKVVVILAGALVYAIGPLMLAIAPTERGEALARGWVTIAVGLFVLPVLWATVFAIAALLLYDSTSAASLIATSSTVGRLIGGVVLAMAGIAGFWVNLKLTKAAAILMGGQLSVMLAVATRGGGRQRTHAAPAAAGASASLSGFGRRVSGTGRGVAGAPGGRGGAVLAGAGRGAAALAGGGLLGVGAGAARNGADAAARSGPGRALAGTRAGVLASRLARAGRQGWAGAGTGAGATSGAPGVAWPTPAAAAKNKAAPAPGGTQNAASTANGNGKVGKPGGGGDQVRNGSTPVDGQGGGRRASSAVAGGRSTTATRASWTPPAGVRVPANVVRAPSTDGRSPRSGESVAAGQAARRPGSSSTAAPAAGAARNGEPAGPSTPGAKSSTPGPANLNTPGPTPTRPRSPSGSGAPPSGASSTRASRQGGPRKPTGAPPPPRPAGGSPRRGSEGAGRSAGAGREGR